MDSKARELEAHTQSTTSLHQHQKQEHAPSVAMASLRRTAIVCALLACTLFGSAVAQDECQQVRACVLRMFKSSFLLARRSKPLFRDGLEERGFRTTYTHTASCCVYRQAALAACACHLREGSCVGCVCAHLFLIFWVVVTLCAQGHRQQSCDQWG